MGKKKTTIGSDSELYKVAPSQKPQKVDRALAKDRGQLGVASTEGCFAARSSSRSLGQFTMLLSTRWERADSRGKRNRAAC